MQAADPDSVSWLRFAFASVTVVGLMALLAWGLKVVSMRGWLTPRSANNARIKMVASLHLDPRRRVAIVQCDAMEYHLLLGVGSDVLLSSHPVQPSPPSANLAP